METSSLSSGAQLTGNVMFYEQPEPLSVEAHGHLGVNRIDYPFQFAAKAHMAPLTVGEFAPAALSYPVVFVGDEKTPIAVMGLRPEHNLFVDAKGEFRYDAYIPAFVRRYPFAFANDDQQQRLILCFDRKAPFVSETPETPFFENGEPSEYTKNCMTFCSEFENERRRTESFVQVLKDLDLFELRDATFTAPNPDGTPGEPQKVADYFAISEEKLLALPPEKVVELRDNGALAQIYAHIISLLGWDRLIAMAFQRAAEQTAGQA